MRSTHRLARTVGIAAVVVALCTAAGCGSDDSSGSEGQGEEEQIKQEFDEWQADFIAGDGDAVCARMTKSAQDEIVQFQLTQSKARDMSCEDAVRAMIRTTREGGVQQQPSKAVSVKIDGDKAVAMVSDAGRPVQPVRLVKEDGKWKLPSAGLGSVGGGS